MPKTTIKKLQAIDDNFLPKGQKFYSFMDIMDSLSKMFLIPTYQLDQSFSISDYRWRQFKRFFNKIWEFYRLQVQQSIDKIPMIYRMNVQQVIFKPRCFCLDIAPTMFKQQDMTLWKCNNCKRYLSFVHDQIKDPLEAYKLL